MVELLRVIRDEYRSYLEERGCEPIAEMYWVVFRFGIIPYAVKALRAMMFDYIRCSQVDQDAWRTLFGIQIPSDVTPPYVSAREIPWDADARQLIEDLISEDALRKISRGGPFGKQGQVLIGRARPWSNWVQGDITLIEHIKERQKLWDACHPWTEGLAILFDTTQDELDSQYKELPEEGQRAALKFAELSLLQRIAYKYLRDLRPNNPSHRFGDDCWIALLRELDEEKVPLSELDPAARKVRQRLQLKRHHLDSWEQCYSIAATSLENAKRYTMRRAVTHSILNDLRTAEAKLEKTPPVNASASTKLTARTHLTKALPLPKKKVTKGAQSQRAASRH